MMKKKLLLFFINMSFW